MSPRREDYEGDLRGGYEFLTAECESLKRRLVAEMCLTRTRAEMLEEFGPDYERWLDASK